MLNTRSFNHFQKALRKKGWLVEWQVEKSLLPSAHSEGPHKGRDVDLDRILFCETRDYGHKLRCQHCHGEGQVNNLPCNVCQGSGKIVDNDYEFEGAYFHFAESDQAIANLIDDVLPALQKSECNYDWDILGGNKIFISWAKKDPIFLRMFFLVLFCTVMLAGTITLGRSCQQQGECYVAGLSGLVVGDYFNP